MKFDLSFAYEWPVISTVDMHTGGEPLRIVQSGFPEIEGSTITEKIAFFKEHFDHLRTRIIWEPRGHADMYAAVLTEAVNPGSDFGVFFLHNEGYSSMCGHAIIAITTLFAISTETIKNGTKEFRIDVPSGTVHSYAVYKGERLDEVAFDNVPSFVALKGGQVQIEHVGKIDFDIAFGGAYYAYVNADSYGISLDSSNSGSLIQLGREIKVQVQHNYKLTHPTDDSLSFLYGVIFYGKSVASELESRNVCIFADGELDRSATGTGVSGKAALLWAKGELEIKKRIYIESIVGSVMGVEIMEKREWCGLNAIIPRVSGSAYLTGKHEFIFDPDDSFKNGFFIR